MGNVFGTFDHEHFARSISLDPTSWNFLTRVQWAQTKDAVERLGFASTAREDQMRLRTFPTGLTKCLEE